MAQPESNDEPQGYLRLKPEVIERLNARTRAWPSRDQFNAFFRKQKNYHGQVERNWDALKNGKPVPRVIALAFVEYFREKLGREDAALASMFDPALPPAEEGAWKNPHTVASVLTDQFTDSDEMYVHQPLKDCLLAARMIAHTLGHKTARSGDEFDETACVQRGEILIGLTVASFAGWLRDVSAGDELFRTVMFFVHDGVKIGSSVILPLKRSVYEKLYSGKIHYQSIRPEDLDSMHGDLFLLGQSDGESHPEVPAWQKSVAQVHAMFYQMAYFTRRLKPYRPRFITFMTNPQYRERLLRHGFSTTGAVMPGSTFPMVTLQHPGETGNKDFRARVPYEFIAFSLKLYRMANREIWRDEDRLRKQRQS